MKKFLVLACLIFCTSVAHAQNVKREQETKVNAAEVPAESRSWLAAAFPKLKKAKWYREVTSGKTSFEAKFKQKGSQYSVEFSEQGAVEDVEKKISLEKLPEYQKAQLYLGFSQLKNFKLVKIQEQWTADSSEKLQQAILKNEPTLATIRYEVEFKAVIDGKSAMWEGLFAPSGQLISKRLITPGSTD